LRPAAQPLLALHERHAQAGIAERDRAGEAREPAADDHDVLSHYNSPVELKRNKHARADLHAEMQEMGRAARAAARELARASTDAKNRALAAISASIREKSSDILEANSRDVVQAKKDGCDAAFVDRLALTPPWCSRWPTGSSRWQP